jgi:preprotein translocase subunit SecF
VKSQKNWKSPSVIIVIAVVLLFGVLTLVQGLDNKKDKPMKVEEKEPTESKKVTAKESDKSKEEPIPEVKAVADIEQYWFDIEEFINEEDEIELESPFEERKDAN